MGDTPGPRRHQIAADSLRRRRFRPAACISCGWRRRGPAAPVRSACCRGRGARRSPRRRPTSACWPLGRAHRQPRAPGRLAWNRAERAAAVPRRPRRAGLNPRRRRPWQKARTLSFFDNPMVSMKQASGLTVTNAAVALSSINLGSTGAPARPIVARRGRGVAQGAANIIPRRLPWSWASPAPARRRSGAPGGTAQLGIHRGGSASSAGEFGKDAEREPLTDTDRAPWLAEIAGAIDAWRARNACGVITCSALKRDYRRRIVGGRAGVRLDLPCRIARADRRSPPGAAISCR